MNFILKMNDSTKTTIKIFGSLFLLGVMIVLLGGFLRDKSKIDSCLNSPEAPILVVSYKYAQDRTNWQLELLKGVDPGIIDCDEGAGTEWCEKNKVDREKLPGWHFEQYKILRYGVFSKVKLARMMGCNLWMEYLQS